MVNEQTSQRGKWSNDLDICILATLPSLEGNVKGAKTRNVFLNVPTELKGKAAGKQIIILNFLKQKFSQSSGNRMVNICVLKSFFTTLGHKRHTCPTYIIRKLTLSCRRVINFPQTPIKWLFEKFILCRVLSIQIVSALKTAFKTSLRHVCYALCNQKTGTEKKKWNVQFYNNTNYICHHLLYFVFFYVLSVKIRDRGNLPLIGFFPYRSLLYILAAILKELLERVW